MVDQLPYHKVQLATTTVERGKCERLLAKGAGKYKGRNPPPITPDEVKELREIGLGPSATARKISARACTDS